MTQTKAALPDFELFDSAEPVLDEAEFSEQRAELWRALADVLNAQPSQLARMELAVALLGALLDDPRIPVTVVLESLGKRAAGAAC